MSTGRCWRKAASAGRPSRSCAARRGWRRSGSHRPWRGAGLQLCTITESVSVKSSLILPPHVEVVGLLHHELGELQRAGADLGGHAHAGLAVVRFLVTLQNSPSPKNPLSPAMSPLRHRSVFGAKSAENGELRKVRFSCPASNVLPGPPNSLVFRRKPAPGVCSAPKSVFYPANSSPLSLSPPKSPVSNASACRGTPQSPPVSNAAARRGPGSEPDSPPRFSHATRQPAELVTADVTGL